MKELFENKRIVEDFRKDKTNSPSYRWKPLQLSEEYDIWLKYYAGDKLDNKIFNVKDFVLNIILSKTSMNFFNSKNSLSELFVI